MAKELLDNTIDAFVDYVRAYDAYVGQLLKQTDEDPWDSNPNLTVLGEVVNHVREREIELAYEALDRLDSTLPPVVQVVANSLEQALWVQLRY